MGLHIAKFVDAFLHTDRYDGTVRLTAIAALGVLITVPLAVIGTTIVVSISKYEAPSTEVWFRRVIGVDPRRFANIQHYTAQGIDFSHHFKFEFHDDSDIEAIVSFHDLSRALFASPLQSSSPPDWYTPNEVPPFPFGRTYSNDVDSPDVYTLFVDDQIKVAYFEHIHF